MFVLDLLDRLLGQVWYIFSLGDSQGKALGFPPASQASFNFNLVTLLRRLVKVCTKNFAGQVLLRKEVLRVFMGVLVIFPMTQSFAVPIGILQVCWDSGDAFVFYQPESFEISPSSIGFGCCCQV